MNRRQYMMYRVYRKLHMMLFGLKPGAFIQDPEHTHLGFGVQLSHGTQIYTMNHQLENTWKLDPPEDVGIGSHSWLGANVIVLPGVILGPHTIVGAGSVVTKSFPEGWCVIAGNPAKKIRDVHRFD